VPLQDHPAEARVIGIADEDDAAELVAPEHVPSGGGAQFAGLIVQVFTPGGGANGSDHAAGRIAESG
jgi:hypothetical protein